MPEAGEIAWLREPESGHMSRHNIACAIAGALAEAGVYTLDVRDPRACRSRSVVAREANLPGELTDAAFGTSFSGEGVALLVDERGVHWVADEPVAKRLRAIEAALPGA